MTQDDTPQKLSFDGRITIRISEEMEAALTRLSNRDYKKPAEIGREAIVSHLRKAGVLDEQEGAA